MNTDEDGKFLACERTKKKDPLSQIGHVFRIRFHPCSSVVKTLLAKKIPAGAGG